MSLIFVLKSIRRYWWLFAAITAAGALAGSFVNSDDGDAYESKAILLISPPSESRTQVSFTNDPDRYVLGQLSVLRSASIAEVAATRVGGEATSESVVKATTIEHEPKTDIVSILVSTESPELSRDIANAYIDVYFDTLEQQVAQTRQGEIDRLDDQLADLRLEIDAIDAEITLSMQPFLPTQPFVAEGAFAPIPSPEQVVPALVSERSLLTQEYAATFASRTTLAELDINARLRVTSEVVQRGTLATEPITESNLLFVIAGLLAGAFFGLVGCVALARVSRTAVDEGQIADVLGVPIFGEMPASRQLHRNRRAAAEALPQRLVNFTDRVAVTAESNAGVGAALTVVVVGAERSAGATTLASALANRFAVNGSQVLLVDVDQRDSELSRVFPTDHAGHAGIPALLEMRTFADRPGRRTSKGEPFTATAVPGLSVVGIGPQGSASGLRRQQLPELVTAATEHAHVVVFDGGPLLDAASTVQLTQLVDAVVLAVPMRKVYTKHLARVSAQLQGRRGELIPVLVPARRRSRRNAERTTPARSGVVDIIGITDAAESGTGGREAHRAPDESA